MIPCVLNKISMKIPGMYLLKCSNLTFIIQVLKKITFVSFSIGNFFTRPTGKWYCEVHSSDGKIYSSGRADECFSPPLNFFNLDIISLYPKFLQSVQLFTDKKITINVMCDLITNISGIPIMPQVFSSYVGEQVYASHTFNSSSHYINSIVIVLLPQQSYYPQ